MRQHRAHVGGVFAGAERVQAAAGVPQLGGQRGEGEAGVGGGAGGGDGEGQRQPGAQGDQLGGRGRLDGEPGGFQALRQQLAGVRFGEHVEGQRAGAVAGDEAGELVAAGDQDQCGGGGGQQRADLGGVAGVVEQDEDLAAGGQAAVEGLAAFEGGGDLRGRDAEGVEEAAERFGGWQGVGGSEAAQVDVELAVGEAAGVLAGPAHGQRGFADSGGAADRGDQDRAVAGAGHGRQGPQFPRPAGEPRHPSRQQIGGRSASVRYPAATAAREAGIAGIAGSRLSKRLSKRSRIGSLDSLVKVAQPGTRLDADFLDQVPPGAPECRQRRGPLARSVQRQHQQLMQPLPQRLGRGQRLKLRDDLPVPAQVQVRFDPRFQRVEPHLG